MEINYPKKLIKSKLNIDCKYLAYPYGETNNLVIALLKKYGYQAAFTIDRKPNPFLPAIFSAKTISNRNYINISAAYIFISKKKSSIIMWHVNCYLRWQPAM